MNSVKKKKMNIVKKNGYLDGEIFMLPSKTDTIGFIPLRKKIEQAIVNPKQLQPQYDGFYEDKISTEELVKEKRLARYQDCDLSDQTENAAELVDLKNKINYVKKKPKVSEKKEEVSKAEQSEANETSLK